MLPGLILAATLATIAFYLGKLNTVFNDVIISILIGALVRNIIGIPEVTREGLSFCLKRILRVAIILLGVQLSFQQVINTGGESLIVILFVVFIAIPVTYLIGKKMGLNSRICALLGVGSAICGASAVLATGPAIKAKERDIALAVSTIFVFNTFALFIFPVLGRVLNLSDLTYGTWTGSAVQDVSSVIATGFAFSQNAGEIATVVKLTRTVFIIPVVFLSALWFAWKNSHSEKDLGTDKKISYRKIFPWYVLGFLGMTILNSLNFFKGPIVAIINPVTHLLILMVMVSVGTGLDFREMHKVGLSFLYTGLAGMLIMSVLSLILIGLLGIGTG